MEIVNPNLAAELIEMAEADQSMRAQSIRDVSAWDTSLDQAHMEQLAEVIRVYGWPTISLVGEEASRAAWLIAQHVPDLDFMKQCLALMKTHPGAEVDLAVAYLEDRVLMLCGKAQIYGTQFQGRGSALSLYPIEDPASVDKRRASVGLGTLAEYEAITRERYES